MQEVRYLENTWTFHSFDEGLRHSFEKVEQILKDGHKDGRSKKDIVAAIDAEWTAQDRLTNEKVGALFPNQPHETKDAKIKRGKRLREKSN